MIHKGRTLKPGTVIFYSGLHGENGRFDGLYSPTEEIDILISRNKIKEYLSSQGVNINTITFTSFYVVSIP